MQDISNQLKLAAAAAVEALRSCSPELRYKAADELEAALNNVSGWTLVTEQTMPPERVRIVASVGTIVYEDCFYGYGSNLAKPYYDRKLWRCCTEDERPLEFTPTSWMPMAPAPEAPEFGTRLPVLQQLQSETAT